MITDPSVSRRKFEREVAMAQALPYWQRQGVWILRAEFPIVLVAFVSLKPTPWCPSVIAAVHIDFSDYDARPPSIKFVDPITEVPISIAELRHHFPRAAKFQLDPTSNQLRPTAHTTFVQSFDKVKAFLCLPGVREYHECSGHSGDSWFAHRRPNGGHLVHLLTVLQRHGPGALHDLGIQVQFVPNFLLYQ